MRPLQFLACLASFLFYLPNSLSQPTTPKQQEEAKKFVEKGQLLYEQGKISKALDAYKKANELSPDSPGPYREMGRCYRDLKQHEQAFHYLSEYLSRKPENEYREGILQYMNEQRPLLATKDKALLSLDSTPQGAMAFVIDSKGQSIGIGATPLKAHPIPKDAVLVRFTGTPFEVVEVKIDGSQASIELSSILDPGKHINKIVIAPKPPAPKVKRTKAFLYFGLGVASVGGSLFVGDQFNRSLAKLDATRSDDPELEKRYRTVVIEAIAADSLGVLAVGAGVLGVLQLRKVKKINREKAASVLVSPNGISLSGSF